MNMKVKGGSDKSQRNGKHRGSLAVFFSLIIFIFLFVTVAIVSALIAILMDSGVIVVIEDAIPEVQTVLLISGGISIFLGYGLSFLAGILPLRPFQRVIEGMNRLASGDYRARLEFSPVLKAFPAFQNMSESFNKMAAELQNTELLRNDFVNNFSHEFKTPIVSIAGFAEILENCELSEEESKQYITAIKEESLRLSDMANNVLGLLKIESREILTDVTEYNISEQIRSALLLLENKWVRKNIELDISLDEHTVRANEELMKQVWINLIDNAIKFSEEGAPLGICAACDEDGLTVAISNRGEEIPLEKREKIFGKFYQADESHSTEGNGIGLAVVKRVVMLHGGEVGVDCNGGVTTFSVYIPNISE